MRVDLEPAYVLHARAYRETSLLVEAFTRAHGRVGLVARGARGSRSRWRSLLQPFRPLLLSWSQRGELASLAGAEQVASVPLPRGESLFCGLYVNELMLRALRRGDAHESLFETYRELLSELAAPEDPQPALRLFERDLLESIGFGLQLSVEQGGSGPVRPGASYRYVPGSGPVRVRPAADDGAVDGPPSGTVSGEALLALQSGRIDPAHLGELKNLMRGILRFHLGDRPLASQALFR